MVVKLASDKLRELEERLLSEQPNLHVRPQEHACRESTVPDGNDSIFCRSVMMVMCQEEMEDYAPE